MTLRPALTVPNFSAIRRSQPTRPITATSVDGQIRARIRKPSLRKLCTPHRVRRRGCSQSRVRHFAGATILRAAVKFLEANVGDTCFFNFDFENLLMSPSLAVRHVKITLQKKYKKLSKRLVHNLFNPYKCRIQHQYRTRIEG